MSETKIEISRETYDTLRNAGQTILEQKALIKELQAHLAESDKQFDNLADVLIKLACAFGLGTDDKKSIRPSILDRSENPTRAILKKLSGLMQQAALAKFDPEAEKQMANEFSFFLELLPIIEYYESRKS
jgi:hypothetical protein